jgi:hypothetical protein
MTIIYPALCIFCGWLGYLLRGAENYHRGFIDGCRECEEYSWPQCREMIKEEIGKFKQ